MDVTPLESWIFEKIGAGKAFCTREAVEAYQLAMLYDTIGWARRNSPFYGMHLADFEETALSSLKDLSRLPFTTAEDIRRNTLQFLCVSQGEISRVVTLPTSGTTGEPKRVYFSKDDQELTIDFFHRGMSLLVGAGDRVLILLPGERPGSVGDLLAKGLERLGAVGIKHGLVQDVRTTLDVMVREKVDTLVGIPVQILALARLGNGTAAPRNILLSTDYVPDAITRELQHTWGCEVFTHYGMTEMGYGGGVECHAHLGYHMREADLLFEIIDPETGIPLDEGKWGEVVFTTLTRRGMPLIRYRTGDVSRFGPVSCPCGTILKSMERVKGRIDGNVMMGERGALCMADLDEALFPLAGLLDFRATLTRENEKDHLHMDICAMEDYGKGMERRAMSALETVPAVRGDLENSVLSISVEILRESAGCVRGVGKRMIIDRRPGQGSL